MSFGEIEILNFAFAISRDVEMLTKGENCLRIVPMGTAHNSFSPCFACQLNPSRDGHVNPTLFAWICQKRINKLAWESESDGVEKRAEFKLAQM
jgi:hypothetical protein